MNHLSSLRLKPRPDDAARTLTLDELTMVGVANPLKVLGLSPEEFVARLAPKGPRVEFVDGRFQLLKSARP